MPCGGALEGLQRRRGTGRGNGARGAYCTALYYYTRDCTTVFNLEGTVPVGVMDGYGRYGSTWLRIPTYSPT